jgi:Domain of unknown function (DUF4349)
MSKKLVILAFAGLFALAACGAAATPAPSESYAYAAATSAPAATEAPASTTNGSNSVDATTVERLIIKNANLSLVVDNPLDTMQTITHLAEGVGGYVVSTNTFQANFNGQLSDEAQMVVRVPSDKLTPVLDQIRHLAVEIKSENISGQDVTADYVDAQSRLTNLEAKEKQLQTILEQTTDADAVIKVFDKLSETREQIELIKGQMKYYKEAAAFSAITLDLIPNVVAQPLVIAGWQPEGTAKDSIETLVRILQGLIDLVIQFTIICGPFLLLLGLPALLFLRWVRGNARRTALAQQTAQPESKE